MIDINQESWDVMVAHAEKTFPNECCGAMLGSIDGDEKKVLNRNAQKILKVLRKEWEMATSDLKTDSGVTDRKAFTVALDELQAAMLVIPEGVYY